MRASLLPAEDVARFRLLEADLVAGSVELAALASHGIPEIRRENFSEPPAQTLDKLFGTVLPADLTHAGGAVWSRAARYWSAHRRLLWEDLDGGTRTATVAFYRSKGMYLPLHAPIAAKTILRISGALTAYARARDEMATSLALAHDAVIGVDLAL